MTPEAGTRVWLERRKWPDLPHYGVQGTVLGRDGHGTWVGAPPGHTVTKGDGASFAGKQWIVWCVPDDGWFMCHFLADHPDLEIYIDIAMPAVWSGRGARLVDVDFDVVVWRADSPRAAGGRIQLVDEDEFEQHSVELGYPAEVIDGARRAAADVLARTEAGEPPFTWSTARPWMEQLRRVEAASPTSRANPRHRQ